VTLVGSRSRLTWAFCGDGDMMKGMPGRGVVVGRAPMDGPDSGRIDEEEVGKQLETEGVDRFATGYLKVLDIIEARRAEAGG
jgi:hypothetical protein